MIEDEIRSLQAKLDDLALRYIPVTNTGVSSSIRRVERMLKRRRQIAEEQIQFFQSSSQRGDAINGDCLSALSFEMAILDCLEDLLDQFIAISREYDD